MAKHIVDVVYEFTIYKASHDFYEKHKKELNDIESGGELTDFLLKNAENTSDVNYYDYYRENLYDYFEDLTRFNRIPFRGRMDECIAKVYFGQNEDKYVIKKYVTFIFDIKDIEDIENAEDAFYSLFDSGNDSCRSRLFQDIRQAEIVAIPENTKLIVVSHRTDD
jgi:hypothetical protein